MERERRIEMTKNEAVEVRAACLSDMARDMEMQERW